MQSYGPDNHVKKTFDLILVQVTVSDTLKEHGKQQSSLLKKQPVHKLLHPRLSMLSGRKIHLVKR